MATFHMSEFEAGNNFAELMEKVRAGGQAVIETNAQPVAIIRPAGLPRGRFLSESLALSEARRQECGYDLILDENFAVDMAEIIANRKPLDTSAWD